MGTGVGARGPPWGRSRSPLASRSSPTWAFGASFCAGRGDAPFNGIAKTTDGGRTWSVVHAESDKPSANLAGSWIEPRAQEDGHSVWFDSPYDLAVAPNDPEVAYATDLFRTYRTVDGGADLGAGELRAPRRRPLDDARPRRHDHVRHPVRPARRATGLHPLHRHRPLPQRGRRRDLDGLHDRHPDALAQHDVLARLRPRGEGPRLGRLQRHPRPAAPQDVAAHRPRALQGRRRRLDGRRPALDALERGHGGVGDHARPARPEEPEGAAARSTQRPSAAASTSRPTTGGRGRSRTRASPPTRGTSRSRGGSRSTRTARSTSSSRAAASAGRIGDADDGALYRSTDGAETWQPMALPPGHERAERTHRRPRRSEAALPLGLGRDASGRRHGRRRSS